MLRSIQSTHVQRSAFRAVTKGIECRRSIYSTIYKTVSVDAITEKDSSSDQANPLLLMKNISQKFRFCDKEGNRRPGKDWNFQIAVSPSDPSSMPPVLRTVNLQRVSSDGIDFIIKKGVGSVLLSESRPTSILFKVGHFSPGEDVEQWRADGHCQKLDLHDIFDVVSHATIVGMVASKRAAKEADQTFIRDPNCPVVSKDRQLLSNHSNFIELVQTTRLDLENGYISNEEIEDSVQAYRFHPNRVERMIGSPDRVVMDRWEWNISENGDDWNEKAPLLPY